MSKPACAKTRHVVLLCPCFAIIFPFQRIHLLIFGRSSLCFIAYATGHHCCACYQLHKLPPAPSQKVNFRNLTATSTDLPETQACLLTLTSAPSEGCGELVQAHCLLVRLRGVILLLTKQIEAWSAELSQACVFHTREFRPHTWPVEDICCAVDDQYNGLECASKYSCSCLPGKAQRSTAVPGPDRSDHKC